MVQRRLHTIPGRTHLILWRLYRLSLVSPPSLSDLFRSGRFVYITNIMWPDSSHVTVVIFWAIQSGGCWLETSRKHMTFIYGLATQSSDSRFGGPVWDILRCMQTKWRGWNYGHDVGRWLSWTSSSPTKGAKVVGRPSPCSAAMTRLRRGNLSENK